MEKDLSGRTLEDFALANGKRGRKVLSILGENQPLILALSTPTGEEFIKRLASRAEKNRIIFDNMDIDNSKEKFAEARARYNESFEILQMFLDVVENQEQLLNQIKKEAVNV